MIKRWGVDKAAGVTIIEKETARPILPSPYGVTVMVGACERGMPRKITPCPSLRLFLKRIGGTFNTYQIPQCGRDFFSLGAGAGELYIIRITDGTEIKEVTIGIQQITAITLDLAKIRRLNF